MSSAQSQSRPAIIGARSSVRCRMMQRRGFGEAGDLVQQLSKGEGLDGSRYGAVVHQRGLVAPAVLYVPIERVIARVDHPAWEPAVERSAGAVEYPVPTLVPVDGVAGVGPESFRVLEPLSVDVVLGALRGVVAWRGGVHESPWGGVRDWWRQSCRPRARLRQGGSPRAAQLTPPLPPSPAPAPRCSPCGPSRCEGLV